MFTNKPRVTRCYFARPKCANLVIIAGRYGVIAEKIRRIRKASLTIKFEVPRHSAKKTPQLVS
ncbi:MAG: hypothetical protein DMG15_26395 [Acidobacteria bacterium]|nr:MAG: hypothetical protein DMG15_26395 [Acidobacteriota bacterium]